MNGPYEFNTSRTEYVDAAASEVHCAPIIPMLFGDSARPQPCIRVPQVTIAGAQFPDNDKQLGHVVIALSDPPAPCGAFVALSTADARRIAEGIIDCCNGVDDASAHG